MLNMLNEKIFLFLWLWFLFVGALSVIDVVYWLFTAIPCVRERKVREYLHWSMIALLKLKDEDYDDEKLNDDHDEIVPG
jgi:hypothetical protein